MKIFGTKAFVHSLVVLSLCLAIQGCKEEEAENHASQAGGILPQGLTQTGKNNDYASWMKKNTDSIKEKEKVEDPDRKLDEQALNLLEVAKVWKTLNFQSAIRVEGYVVQSGINPDTKFCYAMISYFPYRDHLLGSDSFGYRNLDVSFKNSYATKKLCDELKEHKISVVIQHISEQKLGYGSADEDAKENEPAEEDFKEFYQNLIEDKYPEDKFPNLKMVELDQFISKFKKDQYKIIKAKIVSAEKSSEYCKLYFDEHKSDGKMVQFALSDVDHKDRSKEKLTAENCSSAKDKTFVGWATMADDLKVIEPRSFVVTDSITE